MRSSLLPLLLSVLAVPSPLSAVEPYRPPATVPPTGIGFRGDGSGYFPDAKLPVQLDMQQHLRWKVPLVNWSWSSPVPVGNRVLMMAEPTWSGALWPQLCCYDADTGERLWVVDINPLDAFPDMPEETRTAITEDFQWWYGVHNTIFTVTRPSIDSDQPIGKGDPRLEEINAQLAHLDISLTSASHGDKKNPLSRRRHLVEGESFKARYQAMTERIKPYNLFDSKTEMGVQDRSGVTLQTPVSDGEHIWVFTSHHTVACFDFDGKVRWIDSLRRLRPDEDRNTRANTYLSSPRLYGDLLIVNADGGKNPVLAALDKATGKAVWTADPYAEMQPAVEAAFEKLATVKLKRIGSRNGGTSRIIDLDGTPVLLTCFGGMFRLPDGKKYEAAIPQHLPTLAIDEANDIIYGDSHLDGRSPFWAAKLELVGEEVVVEPLWIHRGGSGASPVFADGNLFRDGFKIDTASGWPLGVEKGETNTRKWPQSGPKSRHILLATATHVYGLDEGRLRKGQTGEPHGLCQVYTLAGEKVAESKIPRGDLTDEQKARLIEQSFPFRFSYSCSMNIGGNRLYIASQDHLFCFGER